LVCNKLIQNPTVTSSSIHTLVFGESNFSNCVKNYKVWSK
jgi:hypothetical protein